MSTDPAHFGHAEFFDYGEHLYACDDYPDSMRVTVLYRQWGEFWNCLDDANGADNSCGDADLDLEEGSGLYVQVCRRDGATEIFENCGTEAFFTA